MDSLGVSTEGSYPLLAGGPAIYVASVGGALLGALAGAVVAFAMGRRRRQRIAAIAGSSAGIIVAAIAGYFSENLAQAWVNAFSGNPLEGALVGGAIAGSCAGVAAAGVLSVFQDGGTPTRRTTPYAGLVGAVLGLLAGAGGGSIGGSLAQSALVCPNGYYAIPYRAVGCDAGILQGSLLFGMWAGAVFGAIGALVAALVISRLPETMTPSDPSGSS
jgi:hypothetical protein